MRLIDADSLKERIERTFDMQDLYLPVHFMELIDGEETIEPDTTLNAIKDIKKRLKYETD